MEMQRNVASSSGVIARSMNEWADLFTIYLLYAHSCECRLQIIRFWYYLLFFCKSFSRSVNVNEALRIQMEVQRRLHGELEVHMHLHSSTMCFRKFTYHSFGFFLLAIARCSWALHKCINERSWEVYIHLSVVTWYIYGNFFWFACSES